MVGTIYTPTGNKAVQVEGGFDRIRVFRDRLRDHPYTRYGTIPYPLELDNIWVVDLPDDDIQIIGVHEFTRRDQKDDPKDRPFVPDGYLWVILPMYVEVGGKYYLTTKLAKKIAGWAGCSACVVVFNEDASLFAVYDATQQSGWHHYTWEQYIDWVRSTADLLSPAHLGEPYIKRLT